MLGLRVKGGVPIYPLPALLLISSRPQARARTTDGRLFIDMRASNQASGEKREAVHHYECIKSMFLFCIFWCFMLNVGAVLYNGGPMEGRVINSMLIFGAL